eukprot:m51a1_g13416 hypothetical protein (362) ;mRNA; f:764-1922
MPNTKRPDKKKRNTEEQAPAAGMFECALKASVSLLLPLLGTVSLWALSCTCEYARQLCRQEAATRTEIVLCPRCEPAVTLRRLISLAPQLSARAICVACIPGICVHRKRQQAMPGNSGNNANRHGAAGLAGGILCQALLAASSLCTLDLGAIPQALEAISSLALTTGMADHRPLLGSLREVAFSAPGDGGQADLLRCRCRDLARVLVLGCPELHSVVVRQGRERRGGSSSSVGDFLAEGIALAVIDACVPLSAKPYVVDHNHTRPRRGPFVADEASLASGAIAASFLRRLRVFDAGASLEAATHMLYDLQVFAESGHKECCAVILEDCPSLCSVHTESSIVKSHMRAIRPGIVIVMLRQQL